jgi:hypothetical protein
MTSRGVDFLQDWVSGKLPSMPTGDNALIKMLAQKLRDDVGAAGFILADWELEECPVEQVIRETLEHVAEP